MCHLSLDVNKGETTSLIDLLEEEITRYTEHHITVINEIRYLSSNKGAYHIFFIPESYYNNIKSILQKLKNLPF